MTLTLTLAPEKERRLQQQADRAGLSLDDYVQRALDLMADDILPVSGDPGPTPARTLAEMLEGHLGTVEGPSDLSEDTGPKFAAMVHAKHEAGRL